MTEQSKKITELPVANSLARDAKLVVVVNPTTSPETRVVNVDVLFTNTANLTVVANNLLVTKRSTPANSTITVANNTIWFDSDYLYIAVGNNSIKRVALSSF